MHEPKASRYRSGRCRKDCCRTLATRERRALKWRRFEERELVDGRLVATRPGLPHGEAPTYGNWGCRCVPCTAANARTVAAYRRRKVAGT